MTRIIATKVVPRASALGSNGAFYVDKGVRPTLTRLLAQGSACKDLSRDGQAQAIPPEAAYTPTSNRGGSRTAKKATSTRKLALTAFLKF